MLWCALFALYLVAPVENANILFVTSFPSVSHQKVFQPVWRELSLRGHKVTVITPNPLKDSTLTNLTEVDISSLYAERQKEDKSVINSILMKPGAIQIFTREMFFTFVVSQLHENILEMPHVQKVVNGNQNFDVVIAEWLYPTMGAFAAKFNCPLVGIVSSGAPIPSLDTVGNPSHPIFSPDHNLPLKRDLSFKERIISTIYSVFVRLHFQWVVLPREDRLVKKYFGEDMPYLGDIERNISILLLNRNPVFHRVMPLVPAVIELGRVESRVKPTPLNELKWCALFALYLVAPVENANILLVTSFPSVSHQKVFQPVWRELSLRGHKVTVITPNPSKDSTLTNLNEVDISSLYAERQKEDKRVVNRFLVKPGAIEIFIRDIFFWFAFSKLHATILEMPHVQTVVNGNQNFDVVVVEWLFPTMSAFAAKFNCPLVGIVSSGAPISSLDTVGNPSHPMFSPDHKLPLKRDLSFKERIISTIYSVYVRLHYQWVVLPREDRSTGKFFGEDMPYLGDIERNISISLLNRNPVFHRVMPLVPAVIELGRVESRVKPTPLNEELKAFLDKSVNGVVYFSFGSNTLSEDMSDYTRNEFIAAFSDLPYNVVWKWEADVLPGKPDNVFIQKWVPQISLLGHKNVKVFITQGGLQSMEETISQHVPIIGIPSHSDQTTNVDTAVTLGFGIEIDYDYITAETIKSAIYEIMNNGSYAKNIARIDKLMNDRPIDGLKRAVWWIEYVLRHKGAKHLRSPSMDIPWYQYLLLDVFSIVGSALLLLITIIYLLIKVSLRLTKKHIRNVFSSKSKKE
ncbi:hypothetical protein WA026_020731 [Henosepilachna vigintioctopunctata]|uniref:UDP-glycosyltransferase n=1 Tax=Henosepilachna vigintioctopunctata TaxID=420089 RepID=A0AAW1UBU6_9CUCU